MMKRKLLVGSLVGALLAAGGIGIATAQEKSPEAAASGGMMGGGMMGGGMMGSCPMMGKMEGLDTRQKMQMHAEMMQAMGQIMAKYAKEAKPAAPAAR